jgi:hypothetical protein
MNVLQGAIKLIPFDQTRLHEHGELFPDDIVDDPWIAYHGTSSSRCDAIESKGLEWPGDVVTREQVARVVDIFRAMNWCGLHNGGLPVLEPFSLQHDFGDSSVKPVYLAEYSLRALTFAKKDFAGGETCRALRYALSDLNTYSVSDAVRAEHLLGRGRRFDSPPETGSPVDCDWLRRELKDLEPVRMTCCKEYDAYSHGIVYAVRFEESDLDSLVLHNPMGIKSFRRIEPTRLIAKVIIPEDAEESLDMPETARERYLARLCSPNSMLSRLKKQG